MYRVKEIETMLLELLIGGFLSGLTFGLAGASMLTDWSFRKYPEKWIEILSRWSEDKTKPRRAARKKVG